MRLCTLALVVSTIAAGLLSLAACSWDWNRLGLEFDLRSGLRSYEMQERNFCTMTEDAVELLFDHPTLERLRARAYVARALYSCENVGLALPEEVGDFSAAIKLDPTYARAYLYRGCALSHIASCLRTPSLSRTERGEYSDLLIKDLKTAIELDPHGKPTEIAYNTLFCEYKYQLNQEQNALEICNLAISNLPASELRALRGQRMCRAELYGKLGQQSKEAEDCRAVTKLDAEIAWAARTERLGDLIWYSRKPAILALVFMTLYAWAIRRRHQPSPV